MPCMIWAAIIVELVLSVQYGANWPDFGVLMCLQFLNGFLSFYEARGLLRTSTRPTSNLYLLLCTSI